MEGILCSVNTASHLFWLYGTDGSGDNQFVFSSFAYNPSSSTSASFRMIAHTDLSASFFLRLKTPINFRLLM